MKQNFNSNDEGLDRRMSLARRGSKVHPLTFGGVMKETDNSRRFSKFETKIPYGEDDDRDDEQHDCNLGNSTDFNLYVDRKEEKSPNRSTAIVNEPKCTSERAQCMNGDGMSVGDTMAHKNELTPSENSLEEGNRDPSEIVELPKINPDRRRFQLSKFLTQPGDDRPKFEPEHIVGFETEIVEPKANLHSEEKSKIKKRQVSSKSISMSRKGWHEKRAASHDNGSNNEDDSPEINEQSDTISVDYASHKRRGSTGSPCNDSPYYEAFLDEYLKKDLRKDSEKTSSKITEWPPVEKVSPDIKTAWIGVESENVFNDLPLASPAEYGKRQNQRPTTVQVKNKKTSVIQLQNLSSIDTSRRELVKPLTVEIKKLSKNGVDGEDETQGDAGSYDGDTPRFGGEEDDHPD
jgi:hypothetical protein